MLGLGTKDEPKAKTTKKADDKGSQNDEAKKLLEQMEAKKAEGDCPFC